MIPGTENMFTGDSGEATYLFLILLISLASIARIAVLRKGKSIRPIMAVMAGFLVLTVSRATLVACTPGGNPIKSIISLIFGLAGIYLLLTCVATGRREDDYSLWNPRFVLAGASTGLIFGAVLFIFTGERQAGSVLIQSLVSFMVFAPIGLWAGVYWQRERLRMGGTGLFLVAVAFMASASSIGGLVWSGVVGQEHFWAQLFSLLDIAGMFLYLVTFVFESVPGRRPVSHRDKEAVHSFSTELIASTGKVGIRAVDLSMKIIGGERESKVYHSIVEAVSEETSAEFVLLRTYDRTDEIFNTTGYMLDGKYRTESQFQAVLSKSKLAHFCNEESASGVGFLLNREDLGEDSDAFLPEGLKWTTGEIVVVPIKNDGLLTGFFTAGFFRTEPRAEVIDTLRIYSANVIEVIAREGMKRKVRESRKALSDCREELDAANKLKSNFLSVVSHELRTPLTSVKAYNETLLENVETIEKETIKNFLSVMGEENERVIKLVDNMLSYSSMETGHLNVEKSLCNLNSIIKKSLEASESQLMKGRIDTDLKLPRKDVKLEADPELISQLMSNLISNAVKFTPESGKVSVSLEEEASGVRIVVQDTGSGIPEDQLEKIFERFHQVDASDTREFGGSGLGLAICKNIVEWHDGRIWVENVKEAGARFVVILPMKDIIVRQASNSGTIGSVRFERERYLSLLVEMISEFLQARKASIMMLGEDRKTLNVIAAKGLDPEFVENTKIEIGERIAGRVILEGESYHVFDIEKDGKVGRVNNSAYYGTNSFISIPLKDGNEVVGVLNVSDNVEGREFTRADKEILEAFSGIISRMLKKLDAFEKVSLNFEQLKDAMKSILHIREIWGSRNLNNYTLIALGVGRRLDLGEDSMTALRMGMNMYDLGMMKIPRSIRVKKEELSEGEWKVLREHTNLGYTLLSPMGLDERIMKMVRCHHEYFDGSGYPDGLLREEIPVEARILGVIDAFRALISLGPYRRAFTIDEARNEIIRSSGTKFDPQIVGAFVKVLHELGARDGDGEMNLDAVEQELEEMRKEYEETGKR
ncbi:MAG: GAF domain-containing protein [Bacteroidales bacterium]|nr:GAF domain-containing protein [Candidatus Latescibacterota bacterium]